MKCWIAIDKFNIGDVFIYKEKPTRNDKNGYWEGNSIGLLNQDSFGINMSWESDPIEIEINT